MAADCSLACSPASCYPCCTHTHLLWGPGHTAWCPCSPSLPGPSVPRTRPPCLLGLLTPRYPSPPRPLPSPGQATSLPGLTTLCRPHWVSCNSWPAGHPLCSSEWRWVAQASPLGSLLTRLHECSVTHSSLVFILRCFRVPEGCLVATTTAQVQPTSPHQPLPQKSPGDTLCPERQGNQPGSKCPVRNCKSQEK